MRRVLFMMLLGSALLFSPFLFVRPASSTTRSPAEILLGAGVLWAADGGTRVAYVDFYDNYLANPTLYSAALSSGDATVAWMLNRKSEVVSVLEGEGLAVDAFAEIPSNFTQYNVLYLEAYFCNEPADETAIHGYISNGSGVVIMSASICYLAYYSKTTNAGTDLTSVEPWFGAYQYVNTGGSAYVTVANPLNSSLNIGDQLYPYPGDNMAGIVNMSQDSQVLATWQDGSTYAFTHTYGQGRVYWQADLTPPTTQQTPASNGPLALTLLGGFDYGVTEPAQVKVCAVLNDPVTIQPISGANVTIQILYPNDTVWVSSVMTETISGSGFYEWNSPDTVANMNLQPGVYIAHVTASNGSSSASNFMLFHIDPPPTEAETTMSPFILAMAIVLGLCGTLITVLLIQKGRHKPDNNRPNKATSSV